MRWPAHRSRCGRRSRPRTRSMTGASSNGSAGSSTRASCPGTRRSARSSSLPSTSFPTSDDACNRVGRRGVAMTAEEELIQRYFDAFNRHDIDAVMACFVEHAVVVDMRSEEHTSELQSRLHLVCRLLLEKKKNMTKTACNNT